MTNQKLLKPQKLSAALTDIKNAYQIYQADLERLKAKQKMKIKERLAKLKLSQHNERVI